MVGVEYADTEFSLERNGEVTLDVEHCLSKSHEMEFIRGRYLFTSLWWPAQTNETLS